VKTKKKRKFIKITYIVNAYRVLFCKQKAEKLYLTNAYTTR
jgi:hypothetical protein